MKLVEILKPEDLEKNETSSILYDIAGEEVAKTLIRELGGITLNIPTAKAFSSAIERYITENYHKSDICLARELQISTRTVATIKNRIRKNLKRSA